MNIDNGQPVRLFLADDHRLFVDALITALHQQTLVSCMVMGTALNGADLLAELQKTTPDILLLDLNMPVMSGLDVLPVLRAEYPDLRIVVVTNYNDPKFVRECVLVHEVNAYLHKSAGFDELLQAIAHVVNDQSYIGKSLQLYPRQHDGENESPLPFGETFHIRYGLTRREMEILGFIARAKSNAEIAEGLYISPQTVGVHRKNIMRKLNITSTAGLVRFAIENHLG